MSSLFKDLAPLEKTLDYHLDRENVINSNLANINTPGYRAQDLVFGTELNQASLALEQTDGEHLSSSQSDGGNTGSIIDDATVTPGNDKNSVSLEREMGKMMANSMRYEATADIVSRRLALLRYAASDGQG